MNVDDQDPERAAHLVAVGTRNAPDAAPFEYRGWRFTCGTRPQGDDFYKAWVVQHAADGTETPLPDDADGYGTAAEALRHAQQQAMRWVNDRTGDGQGMF